MPHFCVFAGNGDFTLGEKLKNPGLPVFILSVCQRPKLQCRNNRILTK
jgi:hypothetical protein